MLRSPVRQESGKKIKEKGKRGLLNILFGRTTIIAFLLAVQFVLLMGLFLRWQGFFYAYGGAYILGLVMAIYLSNQPMTSSSRSTWLILVLLMPVLGTLFYLYVDRDLGHRLVRRRLDEIIGETNELLPQPKELMDALKTDEPELYGIARYMQAPARYPVYEGADIRYFSLGDDCFAPMLKALNAAEKFIFMEFFIIDEGEMWSTILDILEKKAASGVEVRVMYDGSNAIFKLPYRYPERLKAKGIQCKMFSPLRPIFSTYHNNRDHRKILVIDGHTAFTGGINLADEYINKREVFGHWKDTAIMLRGEAVRSFTLMFLQMWSVSEREVRVEPYLNAPLPSLKPSQGYVIPYGDNPFDSERVGEAVYLDILYHANRYVHIMTPYLIIDEEMTDALVFAARRGVEVEIILPHVPDKKSAFALAYTHYRTLLQGGVRIFEYTPGFVHAKEFVSDDIRGVVGTINLDYRSLYLHFECGAYLYRSPAIYDIERDFKKTRRQCQEITLDALKDIPLYRKALGPMLKILAPLM